MVAPGNLTLSVNVEGTPDLNTVLTDEIRFYNPETEELETRPKTLGDLVAEKIVDRIMEDRDPWRTLRREVVEVRDKIVREKIEPIIEQALAGEIRLTNSFGEPKGDPVTLRQLIVNEAIKSLTVPLRGSNNDTLLAKVIREQANLALTKELALAAKEAKVVLVDAMRKAATKVLSDEAIGRMTR